MNRPVRDVGRIVMPEADFEQLLELAAERGARKALDDVGFCGDDAANDIRDLRSLLGCMEEFLPCGDCMPWQRLLADQRGGVGQASGAP